VVWTGIIAVTCLLLVLLQHTCGWRCPSFSAPVLYYILLAPMQRLIRAGFGQDAAALSVGGLFFAVLALALVMAFSWSDGADESWHRSAGPLPRRRRRFRAPHDDAAGGEIPAAGQMHLTSMVNKRFKAFTDNFAREHLAGILVAAAGWLPSLLLAPFLTFFFLRDGTRFKKFLARAVPNAFFEKHPVSAAPGRPDRAPLFRGPDQA
jgi:predicted PurR-regulated permease PerM